MKRTILVVEDVEEMADLIAMFLKNEGFAVASFETAEAALEYLPDNPADLVVLDINLPGIDGFEFLNRARKITGIPVLIVTARRSDEDVITGLGYGADDFITKPFSSGVLIARVRALLRRADGSIQNGENRTSFGPFTFDRRAFLLYRGEEQIQLSMKECGVLDFLISNAGVPKTPEAIYASVWKNKFGDLTTVAVYIQRLRRKIEDDPTTPVYIRTEFGQGYCFHFPASGADDEN
jgi:DNA-binding response OmpR family regulator